MLNILCVAVLQIVLYALLPLFIYGQDIQSGGELKFNIDFARFRASKGYTYLELYFAIPRQEIMHRLLGETYNGEYGIEIHLFKSDSLVVAKSLRSQDEVRSLNEIAGSQSLYEIASFFIEEGSYRLLSKLTDFNTNKVGWVEFEVLIQPFSTTELDMSDIQLGLHARRDTSKQKFVKNGYRIIPNPLAVFGYGNHNLYFYTEIYNLSLYDDQADSSYSLRIILKDSRGKIVKKMPPRTKLRKGAAVVEIGQIDVSSLKAGTHEVILTIIDNASSDSVSTAKKFFAYRPTLAGGSEDDPTKAPPDESYGLTEKELDEQFEIAQYVASKEERDVFKKLDFEGKKRFMSNFWKKRDYDDGTEFNEFKHEYLRKVAIASSRFDSGSNKLGWKTDRGRIFITYGEPTRIDRFAGGEHSYQIWTYDHIEGGSEFVFVDTRGFGVLRLVHSSVRDAIHDYNWRTRWAR